MNKFPQEVLELYGKKEFCGFTIKDYYSSNEPLNDNDLNKEIKILLIRPGSRGDVLLLTPIIKAIKEKYPKSIIDIMSRFPEFFTWNPYIRKHITWTKDVTNSKIQMPLYEKIFFMSYEFTPKMHIVEAYSKIVGVNVTDYKPDIYLTDSEIDKARILLQSLSKKRNFIAIHSEVDWTSRRWSEYNWNKLVEILKEKIGDHFDFLEICRLENKTISNNRIPIVNFDMRIVAAILKHCYLSICIDSGILHLTTAVNKPAFSIFSITDPEYRLPERWLPFSIQHDGITKGMHHNRSLPCDSDLLIGIKLEQAVNDMNTICPEMVGQKVLDFIEKNEQEKVSIVIPSYKNFEDTSKCIKSILDKTISWNYEINVIDDASPDDTQEKLKQFSLLCQISNEKENVGFTKNCNRVHNIRGKYILFLNNDTEVINGDWLDHLVRNFKDDETVGVIGAKLIFPTDQTIQHAGIVWNGIGIHIYKGLPRDYIHANKYRYYRAVTGAFLAVRKELWNKLKGFSEDFLNSAEDADFCFRVIKEGKRIAYNPKIEFYHTEGATLGTKKNFDKENCKILYSKWPEFTANDIIHYMVIDEVESEKPKKLFKWFGELHANDQQKARSSNFLGQVVPLYKLEIGSGNAPQKGYIHLDVMKDAPHQEISCNLENGIPMKSNTCTEILANHVLEHLSWRSLPFILNDWSRILVKGGQALIRTPNLDFIINMYNMKKITKEHPDDEKYIKTHFGEITPTMYAILKLFSGQDYPSNFHNACWTYEVLGKMAIKNGFSKAVKGNFSYEVSPGEIQMILTK